MKINKVLSTILSVVLLLSLFPTASLAELNTLPTFSGGDGTVDDPYLISTVEDLKVLADTVNNGLAINLDKNDAGIGNYYGYYFKQTADLDLGQIENWEPIGYSGTYYFAGNYSGDGHTISNMTSLGKSSIDEGTDVTTAGLFGYAAFSIISDLRIENANVCAIASNLQSTSATFTQSYAGGLMAIQWSGLTSNCMVKNSTIQAKGSSSGGDFAGAFAGCDLGGNFIYCASERNDIITEENGGGFIGAVSDNGESAPTSIANSYVRNCNITINSVDGNQNDGFVGGILGSTQNSNANINQVFAYNNTISKGQVAKQNSKSGVVAGYTDAYGIVSTTNTYYYDTNNIDVNASDSVSITVEDFKNRAIFENWNFNQDWYMGPKTPLLRALYQSPVSHTIIVQGDIEHGTVVSNKETAVEDEDVTLTITPDDGYELNILTIRDSNNKNVVVTDNKFTMPDSNVIITAVFTKINYNIIKFNSIYGNVECYKNNETEVTNKAGMNDTVKIVAIPNNKYSASFAIVFEDLLKSVINAIGASEFVNENGDIIKVENGKLVLKVEGLTYDAIRVEYDADAGKLNAVFKVVEDEKLVQFSTSNDGKIHYFIGNNEAFTNADGSENPLGLSIIESTKKAENEYTFTMPEENVNVAVMFAPIQYNVYQYNVGGYGELDIAGEKYREGTNVTATITYGAHEYFNNAQVRLRGIARGELEVSNNPYDYNFIENNILDDNNMQAKFYSDEGLLDSIAIVSNKLNQEDGECYINYNFSDNYLDYDLSNDMWKLVDIQNNVYSFVSVPRGLSYEINTQNPSAIVIIFTMPESDVEIKWTSTQDDINRVNVDADNIGIELNSGYTNLEENQFYATDEVEVKLNYSPNTIYKNVKVLLDGAYLDFIGTDSTLSYTAERLNSILLFDESHPTGEYYNDLNEKVITASWDGSSLECITETGFEDFDTDNYLWYCFEYDEVNNTYKFKPQSRQIAYTVDTTHFESDQYILVKFTMPNTNVHVYAESEDVYREVSTWEELQQAINDKVNPRLVNNITASSDNDVLTALENTNIRIDLNGYKLDRNLNEPKVDGNVFKLLSNGEEISIIIEDTSEDKGGLITGANNEGDGGAFYLKGNVSLSLCDVEISNNKSTGIGGAIYTESISDESFDIKSAMLPSLDLMGTVIKDNEAENIGGVYLCSKETEVDYVNGGDIFISGDTKIDNNNNGNLYMPSNVNLGDVLFGENFIISVTMETPNKFAGTFFFEDENKNEQAKKLFKSDSEDYYITIVDDKVALVPYRNITFDANGGTGEMPIQKIEGTANININTYTRSGYNFIGWNTAVNGSGTSYSDNQSITLTEDVTLYAQWRVISSGGHYSGSSSTSSTITVPVSSESTSLLVSATVQGDTATINALTNSELNRIANSNTSIGEIEIDVSHLNKEINTVIIPSKMINDIKKVINNDENDAKELIVKLSDGVIAFDDIALSTISTEMIGNNLTLNLEKISQTMLNSKQHDALNDKDVLGIYDVYLTSGNKRISDFKNGIVRIELPYKLNSNQFGSGLEVWYVADSGEIDMMPTKYINSNIVFTTNHFSNYVIAYNDKNVILCDKGDSCILKKFSDIDVSAWYHDGLHWAVENNILNGIGFGKLSPNGETSRAMIVTMLWRLENSPIVSYDTKYSDVPIDQWYSNAVNWATSVGIVMGYDGRFSPNDAVTREQLVTILWRYAKYKGVDVSVGEDTNILSYGDAFDISEWAIPAMQWACGSGIVEGYDKNNDRVLGPQDVSNRAVVATMLMRFSKIH